MKLIINDVVTEYSDEGEGPTLLFLPGWMNTLHNFDELALRLTSKYRVIRLDLPGFGGGAEKPLADWHIADYASFVRAFTEKLGLTSYALVGHSFGGRVAIKGTGEGTLRPSRLVLIGAAGISKHRTFRNRFFTLVAKIGKVIMYIPPLLFWRKQLRRKLYKKLGSDYLAAGAMSQVYLNAIQEDMQEYARRISIPTLLIWGENDNMTPIEDGKVFFQLIKDSKLEVLPGAGHSVHRERPEEVARLIEKFVV